MQMGAGRKAVGEWNQNAKDKMGNKGDQESARSASQGSESSMGGAVNAPVTIISVPKVPMFRGIQKISSRFGFNRMLNHIQ
jgi:hypothetical protein